MFEDFAPITAALTAFVRSFDEDYTCELGANFEALIDTDTIIYTIIMYDNSANSFRANFIERFPHCDDFTTFTLSFFHELGHLETSYDMIDDTGERIYINRLRNKRKAERRYYRLHNERIATDWAGEYLTAHHDEMKTWEKIFLEKLSKVLDNYPD